MCPAIAVTNIVEQGYSEDPLMLLDVTDSDNSHNNLKANIEELGTPEFNLFADSDESQRHSHR